MKHERFSLVQKIMITFSITIVTWGILIIIMSKSSVISTKDLDLELTSKDSFINRNSLCDKKINPEFWRMINLDEKKIPESLQNAASKVLVQTGFLEIQNSRVHYLYAKPEVSKNVSVLLLHGQSYSSQTWNDLGTIQDIASFGYYVVAVDLPGYGKSSANSHLDKVSFLKSVISQCDLKNPVIVSPSMSGSFSLPFLLEYSNEIAAFIPISPVGASILQKSTCSFENKSIPMDKECQKLQIYNKKGPFNLQCITVPTMIIYGENDLNFRKSSAMLCNLPNSQAVEIPNGKHSAYLSNPALWHQLLFNFLNIVSIVAQCQ